MEFRIVGEYSIRFTLTLSQTTNFKPFQTAGVCWRQFQIWWKWQTILQTGRKHSRKRPNCSLRAISSFPPCFQKTCTADTLKPGLVLERIKTNEKLLKIYTKKFFFNRFTESKWRRGLLNSNVKPKIASPNLSWPPITSLQIPHLGHLKHKAVNRFLYTKTLVNTDNNDQKKPNSYENELVLVSKTIFTFIIVFYNRLHREIWNFQADQVVDVHFLNNPLVCQR